MKTFYAYSNFLFNYGLKLTLKIFYYEFKFRNYYIDNTPNYIPSNQLGIEGYDIKKITGYSPSYYYYLKLIKIFFEKKKIKLENIYDIGFGTGRVLFFFDFIAQNIYGFEISKKLFDIGNQELKNKIKQNVNLKLYYQNALDYNEYKDNSLIFIFDPFREESDIEILLKKISNLKNSFLVYGNPRFRVYVKKHFKEIYCNKNHNFRGLSIFEI